MRPFVCILIAACLCVVGISTAKACDVAEFDAGYHGLALVGYGVPFRSEFRREQFVDGHGRVIEQVIDGHGRVVRQNVIRQPIRRSVVGDVLDYFSGRSALRRQFIRNRIDRRRDFLRQRSFRRGFYR